VSSQYLIEAYITAEALSSMGLGVALHSMATIKILRRRIENAISAGALTRELVVRYSAGKF
jgi:hypothetical protein